MYIFGSGYFQGSKVEPVNLSKVVKLLTDPHSVSTNSKQFKLLLQTSFNSHLHCTDVYIIKPVETALKFLVSGNAAGPPPPCTEKSCEALPKGTCILFLCNAYIFRSLIQHMLICQSQAYLTPHFLDPHTQKTRL